MHAYIGTQMCGWMDACMHRYADVYMGGWMHRYADVCIDR